MVEPVWNQPVGAGPRSPVRTIAGPVRFGCGRSDGMGFGAGRATREAGPRRRRGARRASRCPPSSRSRRRRSCRAGLPTAWRTTPWRRGRGKCPRRSARRIGGPARGLAGPSPGGASGGSWLDGVGGRVGLRLRVHRGRLRRLDDAHRQDGQEQGGSGEGDDKPGSTTLGRHGRAPSGFLRRRSWRPLGAASAKREARMVRPSRAEVHTKVVARHGRKIHQSRRSSRRSLRSWRRRYQVPTSRWPLHPARRSALDDEAADIDHVHDQHQDPDGGCRQQNEPHVDHPPRSRRPPNASAAPLHDGRWSWAL